MDREEFIKAIDKDFTYHFDLDPLQHELLKQVSTIFENAKTYLRGNFGNTISMFSDSECMKSLRRAERRANAAVVLDYQSYDLSEVLDEAPTYSVKEEVQTSYQSSCFIVTDTFYNLMMELGAVLPLGRNAALTKTALEEARGEFLDAIKKAYETVLR